MSTSNFPSASNSLKYLFVTTTCAAALLAQPVFAQTNQDADDEMIMEEVNVTGIRRSLDFSADIKREANQVVDAITAQDIGLFSDNNIGEALARIPGVLLEREAGEGYRISIRGLGPRFVRTTVNGRTALSPSGGETGNGDDARGFTYNIMPSEVISKAEVSKSTQAYEIEGGIGGSVNLVTNRPLDFSKGDKDWYLSGTARATYNDLLEETRPRATLFYNQTFGENFGLYLGAVWDEADRIDNLAESQRLRTYGARFEDGTVINGTAVDGRTSYDVAHFSGVRYQEQPIERERQTYVTGLQWRNDSWDINFDWTYGTEDEERDDKRFWYNFGDMVRRFDHTITSASIDFDDAVPDQAVPTDGTLFAYEFGPTDSARREQVLANGLYRRVPRDSDVNVGGINVAWNNENWLAVGDIGYASQSTTRLLERLRTRLDTDYGDADGLDRFENGLSGSYDISSGYPIAVVYDSNGDYVDPMDVSHQYVELLESVYTWEESDDTSARLDFTRQLADRFEGDLGSIFNAVRFGAAWNEMNFRRDIEEKQHPDVAIFDINSLGTVVADGILPDVNVPGFIHSFAVADIDDPVFEDWLADPNDYEIRQEGQLDVTEETMAFYLQGDFSGGDRIPWRGNVGVRYFETDQTTIGWVGNGNGDNFVPADPDNPQQTTARTYNDWLPSFNIAFNLSESWVLRFAANKTVSRPDPIDLTAAYDINTTPEDEEDQTGSGGNPNLVPYYTNSFDALIEWYPQFGGNYAIGYFYKNLDGYISRGSSSELITVCDEDGVCSEQLYDIRRPVNTDGGTIKGLEVQWHVPFDFTDSWLQYFGFNGSYTYVDAKMDAVVPERGVPISLRGTSKHSGNFIFYFERKKFGARLAANYRDDYLFQEASDSDRFDEWTEGRTIYDFNFDWAINKNMKLRFTAQNLTGENRSRYWYTPRTWYSDERDNGKEYVLEFRFATQ